MNLVKSKIFIPKCLLLKYKKSIKNIIIVWLFSPFGLIKKALSDLYKIKRSEFLTLFFFYNQKIAKNLSLTTQTRLLQNTLVGLSRCYRLELWLNGIGFKHKLVESRLLISLGFSHLLAIDLPLNCTVQLVGKKKLFFKSVCLQELTQFVAYIQKFKMPDSYKGKGLCYKYKIKTLKVGKSS